MKLCHDIIKDIRMFLQKPRSFFSIQEYSSFPEISWPKASSRDIILQSDTGVELGNPKDQSVSFLVFTNDRSLVRDGKISLLGPDIGETNTNRLPFGRAVLVGGTGFDEENSYTRFREMDLSRYDISLKGYMMRAVSQYMREWSRISKEAVKNGFSLPLLGSAMIQELKNLDYVDSVEILFVTSSNKDVLELKQTGDRFIQMINAMTKMMEDHNLDCESCEFQPVCDEAEELRRMHQILKEKELS
jgi:CO dehydrogenase/acetyl-CoA synthase beta subunit